MSPDGSEVFLTGSGYATVAYDAFTGAKLWVSRYKGPGDGSGDARALGVSPDGSRVFVTGWNIGSGGNPRATVAFDASNGAQLWASRYSGPGNGDNFARALGVSPDGSMVFVTGGASSTYDATEDQSSADYATVAYDASTGAQLWASRYSSSGKRADSATALSVGPDGSVVFVTGDRFQGPSGEGGAGDYETIAYDASTGAQLWASRYSGPGRRLDEATALGVSPDGSSVFVTGYSAPNNGDFSDYATATYDASSGAQRWVSRYQGPDSSQDLPSALRVSPTGSAVFVTGYSADPGADTEDYATVAYDASTGGQLWIRLYDGPGKGSDEWLTRSG